MPHVNFLEPKRFVLPRWEWNELLLFVTMGVLLVMMVTYGLVQKLRLSRLQRELTMLSMSQQAEGGTNPAQPAAVFNERVVWAPVMHAVADAASRSVRLTSLKASVAGGPLVDIEGEAGEVQDVAQFRDRLSRLPLFSKVLLVSSEEGEAAPNKKMQRFHLQGWFRRAK